MIVAVSANPSVDKLFEVDRLIGGAIHRPTGFVQVPGGKGLNVARAAAALGGDVRAVALLRGHAGKWIEESLAAEGVHGSFVWTHGETRASLSVADRESGGLTEFYEHGSEIPSAAWPELEDAVARLLPQAAWLTISGSLPPGSPSDGYVRLVAEAREARVPVALDAAREHLGHAIASGPDVVKVNAGEAGELLATRISSREEALAAADELRRLAGGEGHAGIVTRGAKGVAVAAPDGSRWEGRLYVRGRYPVGSGDSFLAGLVVALERHRPWPEAIGLALGAAAANAELPGAGRLDPARAELLASGADVRQLDPAPRGASPTR
jgi:1-phosphofructokinase family hexose kinase